MCFMFFSEIVKKQNLLEVDDGDIWGQNNCVHGHCPVKDMLTTSWCHCIAVVTKVGGRGIKQGGEPLPGGSICN